MIKKYKKTALGLLGSVCILSSVSASAEMLWSDFRLSFMKGTNYEVGDSNRTLFTLEHTSGHSWGDNYFFIDRLHSKDGTTDSYFELSPRLSLSSITGADLAFGPVKDILVASTWEAGEGFDNYLYGIGFNLDVPKFNYVSLNFYKVSNDLVKDDEQLTLAWGLPFTIGSEDFLYDGFVDWSSGKSDHAAEMNYTSQLKWDVGKLVGIKSQVYIGVKYVYWINKFGIKGANERNPNLMVQWHF